MSPYMVINLNKKGEKATMVKKDIWTQQIITLKRDPKTFFNALALSLGPKKQPMKIQIYIGLILRPETC